MSEWLGHFQNVALYALAPFIAFSAVNWIVAAALARYAKVDSKNAQLLGVCFGAIGIAVGLLMGASREAVVGTIVPALLTFLSGFAVYQFGKDAYAKWRPILPIALCCLVLGTICAVSFGGSQRNAFNERQRRYEEWRINYEQLQIPLSRKKLESQLFPGGAEDKKK
jgi:uncharacterized protein YqgC (DUF456 family)